MNCCVLKFLRRIVDGKHMVSETPIFKFPQHSVMGPQPSAVYYRLSPTAFVILVSSMLLIIASCKCIFIYEEQTKCLTNLLWINVLITIQVPLFKGVQWIFIVYSSIVCSFWIIAELFIFGKCYDEFTFVFVEKVRKL